MPLPTDPSRLSGITDALTWRKAVEKLLASLDTRIAARHMSLAGMASVWIGTGPIPAGHVQLNGQTLTRTEHQELHAALGSPGGPGASTFVVPTLIAPVGGGVWVVRG